MFELIKKIFKKKQEDILYLTEEVKFDNVAKLKIEDAKISNPKDTQETKSTLTFGK